MFGTYLVADQTHIISQSFGYLMMIPSFIIVVFGIKRFCDLNKPDVTRFTDGAIAGFAIVGVMSVIYALGWELYLFITDYSFMDQYIANELVLAEERGLSGLALEQLREQMATAAENYQNWFFRFGITIMEIFPIGLLVALVSILLLRNPDLFKKKEAA